MCKYNVVYCALYTVCTCTLTLGTYALGTVVKIIEAYSRLPRSAHWQAVDGDSGFFLTLGVGMYV